MSDSVMQIYAFVMMRGGAAIKIVFSVSLSMYLYLHLNLHLCLYLSASLELRHLRFSVKPLVPFCFIPSLYQSASKFIAPFILKSNLAT